MSLGVLVSAACSFSTDGITFIPDDEFDALAGGTSHAGSGGSGGKGTSGAHSGGKSADAGSDSGGDAGEDASGGTAGSGKGGSAGLGKGGGSAGHGVGGTAGLGAGGKGGSFNMAGSGVGGGIAGMPTNAGGPGNGGSGGLGPTGTLYPCTGEAPADKLIADFKGIVQLGQEWRAGQMGNTRFSVYGFPDPGSGKPNVKLGADDLTVEAYGVQQPMGAGIRIAPCITFKGAQSIGFTISGDTKSGIVPVMVLRIYTNQNLPANDMTREGMCLPPAGQDPFMSCQPAHVDFNLPTMPTQLEFRFPDFKGGKPSDTLQLDQIKMLEWGFTSGMTQTPYDGNFKLDDVVLYY